MQSNLYSDDLLFNYYNEFDGGPANYPPPPPPPGPPFENGNYGFVPLPPPVGLPCPVDPMIPVACITTMMGPMPPRGYGPIPPPALAPPLQTLGPGSQPPAHHFGFQQQPQQQFSTCAPLDSALERTQLNDMGQFEQVVVKNGQVFHISFVDEPGDTSPPTALPAPGNEEPENEESQSRDWINYDELPLLAGGESEDGRYQCDLCSKVLKSALNLYIHKQTHKTTRLDCTICGKRFNRIGKLEHHTRRHHSTEHAGSDSVCPPASPVSHSFNNYCVECEEFFLSSEELHSHMEQNHRLIDDSRSPNQLKKSIGCPYCNEMFEWPCLLKTHMTKHTGEKPFICERCNVSFRFVQSFYRHNRRVHGREK